MKAPEVVRRYAATLLEAAQESQSDAVVRRDVEGIAATLDQAPELAAALSNRLLSPQVLHNILQGVFGGKVQQLTLNFILLVADRRRAALLPDILRAFVELADEQAGLVTAEVRTSIALTAEQEQQLHQRLESYTGQQVRLQTQIDASLKGGMIARVGDTVFDGSLTAHLERLHRHLSGA